MTVYPECLETLISELKRFPGIGQKSAERLAFHIFSRPMPEIEDLSRALLDTKRLIRKCSRCNGIAESPLCKICDDPKREDSVICVVEQARDVFALEKGGMFRGHYHVLGGVISPLSGVGPEDLDIGGLEKRIKEGSVEELVLALNPSTEGETTSIYLAELINPLGVKVSRIAYGLPVGGELEFSDPVTLARAWEGRRSI